MMENVSSSFCASVAGTVLIAVVTAAFSPTEKVYALIVSAVFIGPSSFLQAAISGIKAGRYKRLKMEVHPFMVQYFFLVLQNKNRGGGGY